MPLEYNFLRIWDNSVWQTSLSILLWNEMDKIGKESEIPVSLFQ